MVAAVFAVVPLNIGATEEPEAPEEPNDPIEEDEEYWIDANGTYFEITDSEYLNITIISSENIKMHLESIPKMISFHIESNCNATSTEITISGFEASKTYYRYQDINCPSCLYTRNGSNDLYIIRWNYKPIERSNYQKW
jgi:hypothetical protein